MKLKLGTVLLMKVALTFDFKCPDRSQWLKRAIVYCPQEEIYTCLYDTVNDVYVESCEGFLIYPEGNKVVIRGYFDIDYCTRFRYQPVSYSTAGYFECMFRKSNCVESGQLTYDNGTTKSDRNCYCDDEHGYFLVINHATRIKCMPSQQDCFCVKRFNNSEIENNSTNKASKPPNPGEKNSAGLSSSVYLNREHYGKERTAFIITCGFLVFCMICVVILLYREDWPNEDFIEEFISRCQKTFISGEKNKRCYDSFTSVNKTEDDSNTSIVNCLYLDLQRKEHVKIDITEDQDRRSHLQVEEKINKQKADKELSTPILEINNENKAKEIGNTFNYCVSEGRNEEENNDAAMCTQTDGDLIQNSKATRTDLTYLAQNEIQFMLLQHFFYKVVSETLRHYFNQTFQPDDVKKIAKERRSYFKNLRDKQYLSAEQFKSIYNKDNAPCSSEFDIQTMIIFIRKFTNCLPIKDLHHALPRFEDDSIGADLARVAYYRNYLEHNVARKIEFDELYNIWTTLRQVVERRGTKDLLTQWKNMWTTQLDNRS